MLVSAVLRRSRVPPAGGRGRTWAVAVIVGVLAVEGGEDFARDGGSFGKAAGVCPDVRCGAYSPPTENGTLPSTVPSDAFPADSDDFARRTTRKSPNPVNPAGRTAGRVTFSF